MTQPFPIDAVVRRDQARAILGGVLSTLVSNTFVSCSLVGMTWDTIPRWEQALFFGANAAVNLARLVTTWRWQSDGFVERAPERVLTWVWIGSLLTGLCWVGALVSCAWHGQAYTTAVGLVFCGMNAGSVIQNKVARPAAIAFVLPNFLLMVLLFVAEGSLQSQIIAVNLTLLTALMFRWSRQQEIHYLRSRRLHYEAIALTESLKAANLAGGEALRRLEHTATHDHLTGLFNRAAYQAAVDARLERAAAPPAWLMLIDLDRFKTINDRYGHEVGDAVLVGFCAVAGETLPDRALFGRLGGEEFACLLVDVPPAAAMETAECLRRTFSAILLPELPDLRMSVSVGVAQASPDCDFTRLLRRADGALYAAKARGRDRIECARHALRAA